MHISLLISPDRLDTGLPVPALEPTLPAFAALTQFLSSPLLLNVVYVTLHNGVYRQAAKSFALLRVGFLLCAKKADF